ncbi:hypothetical protein FJV46_02285 [Arthrobacter agilis]|uniref:hypothetical protein n=1 Tax=Arthrobacter agilis TaxID=37921 RepID=UPI000B35F583|nr:hypothetical protein [Arthrobacter agilis]OUM40695.1 hypothetical protein B8W74_14520 [Arthrobacter agilis]PPB45304.1 hypothetical protein CI784_14550 [Arthrobacter agilis]TPV28013.1 hypothetical protein FJV46_02285 [Arthrobacter agilis]VDR31295.1 Uncharacterised protein [Arthrobacter agilis]
MPSSDQPNHDDPNSDDPSSDDPSSQTPGGDSPGSGHVSEAALRARQDLLVRELAVEQNGARLQALSDELEVIQRRLEQAGTA